MSDAQSQPQHHEDEAREQECQERQRWLDYFAGCALTGFLARPRSTSQDADEFCVRRSYQIAEDMMAERLKRIDADRNSSVRFG